MTAPRLRLHLIDAPADARGVTLSHGAHVTPAGIAIAIGAQGVLWGLGFVGEMDQAAVLADLGARWPHAALIHEPQAMAGAVDTLIRGAGDLTLRLVGTPFQLRVWRALADLQPGETTQYATLAQQIGQPRAAQAVGNAVGRNPISWAIPCHRVLRRDGALGGYHWGAATKRALLTHEGALAPLLPIAGL